MQKGVKCTYCRTTHSNLCNFFSVHDNTCYCSNIDGLFESLDADSEPPEWRLFIDCSTPTFGAVLLHNNDEMSSVSFVHAIVLNETYNSMELILRLIKYSNHH